MRALCGTSRPISSSSCVWAKTSAGAVSYIPVARVPNIPALLKDLKKQAEAGDRFTPDTLPAGAPHAEFVKATDAMNARLDALDLSEVEIEEIEDPKE